MARLPSLRGVCGQGDSVATRPSDGQGLSILTGDQGQMGVRGTPGSRAAGWSGGWCWPPGGVGDAGEAVDGEPLYNEEGDGEEEDGELFGFAEDAE